MLEMLKVLILGIVEGITEWLPVSSTGHLILVEEFVKLGASEAFKEMFNVVIQLGAILAVVVMFWRKLNPISLKKTSEEKKETWKLWFKVIVACLPAAVLGILLDDWMDEHLHNYIVVAAMLIIYGVLFIVIEKWNQKRTPKVTQLADLTYQAALVIGAFQVLSLIPGTSRSGATIIGALLIGVSRYVAAEFTFFLAIPVMVGASGLKILKFISEGNSFTGTEVGMLLVGCISAFVVSLLCIKFLMAFVKKHDFQVFGWYRVLLGLLVLGYFFIRSIA